MQRAFTAPFFALALLASAETASADATPAATFRIVESVPEGSAYGTPGVPRTRDVWLDMLRHASRSIDIAAFYFADRPDGPLSGVMQAVIDRAHAGVHVRIVVEESFMKDSAPVVARLKAVPNVSVEILPTHRLTGGVLHAKFMIVDGVHVFVGSQNWDWRALTEIHEIGAEMDDPAIGASFETAFGTLWALGGGTELATLRMRPDPGQVFSTMTAPALLRDPSGETVSAFPAFSPPTMMPPRLTAEEPALVAMIRSARHAFRLQVMTLSAIRHYGPKGYWMAIDGAIRDAAARGVSVQIIVADWALREPMQSYLRSLAVMPNVEVRYSTVPRAASGFIPYARVEHCKYAIVDDDTVYIGTGNWEWSYFNNTVDASVFVHGRGPAATLGDIFARDWSGPYVTKIEPGGHYVAPREG